METPRRLRAVALDFDGVLVRSMEQHAEAYRRVLAPYGFVVEDADVFHLEGARSESVIRTLLETHGVRAEAATVQSLADEKQALFRRLGRPLLYPGAEMLVRGLRPAVERMGLVTGTRRENVDDVIPDLAPLLDAVVAQDGYRHDKPHPEPFQRIAHALGVPAASCAALENAPRGVQSAKAAGYAYVVGLTTTVSVRDLEAAGADAVAESHGAAATLFAERIRASGRERDRR